MSILVTGGTGYIGSHTVVELISKGDKVVIVDNLAPRKMRGFISEGMVLSADTPDGGAQVIFVDDMTPGCKVR